MSICLQTESSDIAATDDKSIIVSLSTFHLKLVPDGISTNLVKCVDVRDDRTKGGGDKQTPVAVSKECVETYVVRTSAGPSRGRHR